MYNTRELFEPYQGFIQGNMFKEVYDGCGKVYEISPGNEQAELLTYIDVCDFGMMDLGMYLDLYPDDTECIKVYNQFRKDKDAFVKKYENCYGPLTMESDALDSNYWSWMVGPWPWEV